MRATWVEIDLSAVAHNIRAVRRHVGPGPDIMAVVKADAYGHGALEVSRTALENGASMLGVALVQEAAELRNSGIKAPLLVFGEPYEGEVEAILRHGITPVIYNMRTANSLSGRVRAMGRSVPVHVKVDTGMGRVGVPMETALDFIMRVKCLEGLFLEGICTHFATSDEADPSFTREQIAAFESLCKELALSGINVPLQHAANSGAVLQHPDTHLNMVRPGIMLYGLYPSRETRKDIELRPAMRWVTHVAQLKTIPPGCTVSYGRTFCARRPTTVATLPVGYADGYPRRLSNISQVLAGQRRAPVIGRVCMDLTMIDVTDIPGVTLGEEVILMGRQGRAEITADEMAGWLGTVNYEVLTGIGKRVPRLYQGASS
ncbi:MAG: alanine racemase [Deltaproteobacteria bacterium]|nr:alanine racemase [Deltaproteobacteria bacterium]